MIFINDREQISFKSEQHGYFYVLSLNKNDSFNCDCLNTNLLIFIFSGKLEVTYNEFIGQAVSQEHTIHFCKSGNFRCKAIYETKIVMFAYSVPRSICDRSSIEDLKIHIKGKRHNFPAIKVGELIYLYLKDILRYNEENAFDKFKELHEIKEKELFILFRTQIQKQDLAELFREIVSDSFIFKNLVLQHYANAKNTNELSDLCGYSPKTFSRIFRKYFNTTPYKWLQHQKSKLIPAYIAHRHEESLIIISESFGFSSLSHFNSFCRKYYGLSAKNFRDNVLEQKSKYV